MTLARRAVQATARAVSELADKTQCQINPDLFDGPHDDEIWTDVVRRVEIAREYCIECPVFLLCRAQGDADMESYGILGGGLYGAWIDPRVIIVNEELAKKECAA